MLLLALGRVGLGPERTGLIPYETADERFKELWEEFGQPGTPPRVYYPFGRLRNDERQTSASAKPSALGSRANSDRTSTICYATNRNSYPALLTRSCPNTSRHRSIGTSWRPCESRRGHPPSVLTNPCPKEAGRSGSTRPGIPGSAGRSLRRTTNAAPCVSMTSGSATGCSDWRPRNIRWHSHNMAEMWCRMAWRRARCITRHWIVGRWACTRRVVGFGS